MDERQDGGGLIDGGRKLRDCDPGVFGRPVSLSMPCMAAARNPSASGPERGRRRGSRLRLLENVSHPAHLVRFTPLDTNGTTVLCNIVRFLSLAMVRWTSASDERMRRPAKGGGALRQGLRAAAG